MTDNDTLARQLRHAVAAQDFGATPDAWRGGLAVAHFPSIDLAVVHFRPDAPPRWANVLFSRAHPHGLTSEMSGMAGAVSNIRFDADQRNANGDSVAWLPGADWSQLHWTAIDAGAAAQHRPQRFVAPYPASLLKLMVAVGVGLAVDQGLCDWPAALQPMLALSDNAATDALVALLHRHGVMGQLNARFAALNLPTLQLHDTTPQGGWRNADGAGVGHIHMTAWDTARLLWLLDADAPPAPWLPPGTALLQPATRDHLLCVLQGQQLDHVLSSGSLRGLPGWVPGLPDAPVFAHKTGSTDNYVSDAGIVDGGRSGHYIVALLSSLGRRHAAVVGHPRCVTTWRVPALGAAIHRLMATPAG